MTRKEEMEAEVHRIMSLPDDEQADEILKMVDAPLSDRQAFVEAYMRQNQKADKPPPQHHQDSVLTRIYAAEWLK